jgi:CheY-like chemotaxis protein
VLIVDDDVDARELTKEILGNYGADVSTAATADEAVEALRHREIDALVSDISLPGEDGYSLIRRIRASPAGRNLPALALTAHAAARAAHNAAEAGFQRYLCKPFEPMDLVTILADLVPRKEAPGAPVSLETIAPRPAALEVREAVPAP